MEATLQLLAFVLIVGGLLLAGLGVLLESFRRGGTTRRTRFGALVLIGPIPIAVGSDSRTVRNLVYLGIALTVILIALTLLNTLILAS